jgi:hypothetical protein
MPTFLGFYLAGLALSFGVGLVLYYTIGGRCTRLLQKLFGDNAGYLWGRTFRLTLITLAMVGGLTTQWYGCHGYTDYEAVKHDPRVMFQKSTEQVTGAISYATTFLAAFCAVAAVAFAVLCRNDSGQDGRPGGVPSTRDHRVPPAASPSQTSIRGGSRDSGVR